MRFKIILEVINNMGQTSIPLSYQYELSAWIYKTLNYGDPHFAEWLHSKGYSDGKKTFKLFTFSNLKIENYSINGDRLHIKWGHVFLYISFYPVEAITPFITGLFNEQKFTIGDKKSKVSFAVKSIEKLAEPDFANEMKFRCLSPLMISRLDEGKSRNNSSYLSPRDEKYAELFRNNLVGKYNTFYKKAVLPEEIPFALDIIGEPRSKLIVIKAFTEKETKLKGYVFEFVLKAPEEFIKLGYYAGFGEKNSLGFGCTELCANSK